MLSKGQAVALLVLAIGSPLTRANTEDEQRELSGTLVISTGNIGAADNGILGAAPVGTGPEPGPTPAAPAPGAVIAPQVICTQYWQSTGCDWTREWNCPGQTAGSKGAAGNDDSDGYKCCCLQGLWQNSGSAASPTPAIAPVSPTPSTFPDSFPGAAGPEHFGHPMVAEVIPRSVQLKHKLIQWYENTKQCPLNQPGFPAWVGWKTATENAPAVTTPPKGIAGNRTLFVTGFCPYLRSETFDCVKEDGELKARVKPNGEGSTVYANIDELGCTMQDIVVYRLDNHLGVRFDFVDCRRQGDVILNPFGGRRAQAAPGAPPSGTTIKSASMNSGLEEDRFNLPGSPEAVQFTEFMLAVCPPDGKPKPNVLFKTANLPKFARTSNLQTTQAPIANVTNAPTQKPEMPSCFSETANSAHVFGKGCFDDFLFFELQDHLGNAAKIPAHDLERLSAQITHNQHWRKPVPVPSPVPGTPGPAMHWETVPPTPAPTPSPTTPAPEKPGDPCDVPTKPPTCSGWTCPAGYSLRPNPVGHPCNSVCCQPTTTFTTTVWVPEVPGVAIVDRICIQWSNCGQCNNLCDCAVRPPVSGTTTTTVPPVVSVCEDYWGENLLIAILSFLVCCPLCCWFHDRCVGPWMYTSQKEDYEKAIAAGKYQPSQSMQQTMTGAQTTMNASMSHRFSHGVSPTEIRTLSAKKFESQYLAHKMALINFISTGLICFAFVHIIFWLWGGFLAGVIGLGHDLVWNPINLEECPFSLFPICIALWMMNWFCLVYYFAWQKFTYTVETCETPVAVEVNVMQQEGWWRFFNPIPWVR